MDIVEKKHRVGEWTASDWWHLEQSYWQINTQAKVIDKLIHKPPIAGFSW